MPKLKIVKEPRVRRATNVTLPVELVVEAKALQVNVSQACQRGLAEAVHEARRAHWLEQNRRAIESYNERIEREGPTLEQYRRF